MALGITPNNDQWRNRLYGVGSAFTKGDLLNLTPARTVRPYLSTDSQFLGVALHNSADSAAQNGQALVAIPLPGAEATFDVPTGMGNSDLSAGEAMGVYGSGARTSFVTALHGSPFSQLLVVSGPLVISEVSRVRCVVNPQGVFYSTSTNTFLT